MLIFCLYLFHPNTYTQNWQYFHNPATLPRVVNDLCLDASGQLWYTSGSIVGNFNGSNWNTHDFTTAGISIPYNFIRRLASAPDGKIWCSAKGRVLALDPISDAWTLHLPTNPSPNADGWDIKVDPNGMIYWANGRDYFTYDGATWVRHYFAFPPPLGDNIEENSVREIILDFDAQPWLSTSGSLGIETGIITPAGVIHASPTDTTVIKMSDLGYPTLMQTLVTRNGQGNPMICVGTTDTSGNRRMRVLSYEFGAWQNLGDSPPTQANIYGIYQDPIGNVWIIGSINFNQPQLLRRYPNGSWNTYFLDSQEVSEIFTIRSAANGDIWIGGRLGSEGVLIKSPVPPIGPAKE